MAGTQYRGSEITDVDQFINDAAGLASEREQEIGQHIGYRYDVNLVPDYSRLTPFLERYMEIMGWDDLNWLEDVHMGYEDGQAAVFDRNINGWGQGARQHRIAGQPAGPRHDRPRIADQVPDVGSPSPGDAQASVHQVLMPLMGGGSTP